MSDGSLPSRSPRAGRSSGFFPNSFRAIIRSASSLASTVRSAGSSVASTISSPLDERQREQVQWAGFDVIELGPGHFQRVLLLTYLNGFQVWNVEDANDVWEIASKRDGPVAFCRIQPQPITKACDEELNAARPFLLVVTTDNTNCRSTGIPSRHANGFTGVVGSPPSIGENYFVPALVKFYSLRSHTYVHTLRFRTAIHSVRCSTRIVAVALANQVYCFDAATLKSTFSVLTYPSLPPGASGLSYGYGPLAVGPRWLAYAGNQPLFSNTGRVSPQRLTPSPGVSPSTSPANGNLVTHYAKESSKQLAVGIVTLGDLGYKAFSKYCTESVGSPEPGSPLQRSNSNIHSEHAGTVIVRDFVSKVVVSHFRAHESPLFALYFDPTGTLLATASIHGHNINIFRIMPVSNTIGNSCDATGSYAHLYRLSRGLTNAIIQDIAFSEDSHWIVVSSSRGTNHLYSISPFGGMVGPSTPSVDAVVRGMTPIHLLPWWCSFNPVRSTQQASSFPPPTVNTSVVSRIKNGNAGWRGTVSGAAAAASGRSSSPAGAVAVFFHDGRGHKQDTDIKQACLKEQLWALSPSGHLTRYAINFSAVPDGYQNNFTAESPKEAVEVRVGFEPLQRWDVSRKPNHVEREEKIDNSGTRDIIHEGSGSSGKASVTSMRSNFDNGGPGREETISEEMHRVFLSNAEVQMYHFRPPLWAKSQISFQVFGDLRQNDSGGEFEIEKLPTRVVEVRKRDLVPVLDRFRNYQFGEDVRDKNIFSVNSSSFHSGMAYGFIRGDGMQIQRSSSGSSCGSEGSLCGGPNMLQNGVHHAYQELYHDHQLPFSSVHESKQKHSIIDQSPSQNNCHPGSVEGKMRVFIAGSPPFGYPHLGLASHDGAQAKEKVRMEKDAMMKMNLSSIDSGGILANGHLPSQGDYSYMNSVNVRSNNSRDGTVVEEVSSLIPMVDEASARIPIDGRNTEGKFDMQDFDAATEDVESTGKSEDFGGEQGEDGWEGTMFAFAEDS